MRGCPAAGWTPDATRHRLARVWGALSHLWSTFAELIRTPFLRAELIWGIVPLYFGLLLSETTSARANFRTAIQTGFSFLWAGAHWLYTGARASGGAGTSPLALRAMPPVSLLVTVLVLLLGGLALFSGLRRRFPRYGRFLGHTRFANYFMIAIFPIQANQLPWTWERLAAITLFALPVWLALHFGLMPLRGKG